MLQGIDSTQTIEFSFSNDSSEPKTVFVLKPLSGSQMIRLTDVKGTYDSLIQLLKTSIIEIRDFSTKDVDEAIDILPPDAINELLEKVNSLNHITKEEEKN